MGNCCCSGSGKDINRQFKQQNLRTLIKIQAIARSFLAKKKLRETREMKIKTLFGSKIAVL